MELHAIETSCRANLYRGRDIREVSKPQSDMKALAMMSTHATVNAEINRHTRRNAPSLGTIGVLRCFRPVCLAFKGSPALTVREYGEPSTVRAGGL